MQYFIFISGHIHRIYHVDQYDLVMSKLDDMSNDKIWNILSLTTNWKCHISTSNKTLPNNKITHNTLENNKLLTYKIYLQDYIVTISQENNKLSPSNIIPIKLSILSLSTCAFYIFDGSQIIELISQRNGKSYIPLYGQKADYLIKFIHDFKLNWNKEIKNVANTFRIHKYNDHSHKTHIYNSDYIQICSECQIIKLFSPNNN